MRTTVTLDDDVFALAKEYAESRSLSLGKAVSDLVRRGADRRVPTKIVNGLHVFDLPADSPRVTSGLVRRLESEDE